MGTINIFILKWMIHFFVAFFYPLQDISFLSSSLHSIPWILRQLRLLDCSLSSYLIMSWSIVFAWMAIFPSSSLIFQFCWSNFSSNLEIISYFNFLNMSSEISYVANGLTNSEKYSRISCDTDIFVIFVDELVITIQKPRTIFEIKGL